MYPVSGFTFSFPTVTNATLSAQAASISADSSTVDLRNPHGHNSPSEQAPQTPTQAANDDGRFSLTLSQFFRAFEFEQHGFVPT